MNDATKRLNQKSGAKRIYFIGTIKLKAPLHIGQGPAVPGTATHETDQPVLLDWDGRPFIPATALGGVMRSVAENLVAVLDQFQSKEVSCLTGVFGSPRGERGERQGKGQNPQPSKLRIRHAKLKGDWRGWTEVRDGVGIDRQRGVAKYGVKFDYEVIPPGLEFDLLMELRDGEEQDKTLLALVLTALETLPLSVGAKGGSGLGALELSLEKVVELDLTNSDDFLGFITEGEAFIRNKQGKSWHKWQQETLRGKSFRVRKNAPSYRIPQAFIFTYRLSVEDPLLVRGRAEPMVAFDGFKKRREEVNQDLQREKQELDAVWIGTGKSVDMTDWEPFLPGSSLRGVFRSHCERILRTLSWHYTEETLKASRARPDKEAIRQKYMRCVAAAVDLWRERPEAEKGIKTIWEKQIQREGIEEQKWFDAGKEVAEYIWKVSDLSERLFGSTFWKSRVVVSEAYIPDDKKGEWKEALFDHLAVERFSGGAMEGKKFDALPIIKATFEGKVIVFGDELWTLGLIALLFKDLADGWVRIGSGKTRGYGRVIGKVTKVEAFLLPGSNLASQLAQCENATVWQSYKWCLGDGQFPQSLPDDLGKLLQSGVKELNEIIKVKGSERQPEEEKGGEDI